MADLPARYAGNAKLLGPEVMSAIRNAKVLVVGAGGLGCEQLKTLALTGFEHIDIIDLDTIDASNLNRQFLFRKGDLGLPKAVVAQRAAARFNPRATITAHHGNVKDPQYGDAFFGRFDLVISGLDNVDARKHVNRLCVKTGRPLIESGSRGYAGQVQPIIKGRSECYDCRLKTNPRQYAYCTIRSSPTLMVHCVAYAKVLYEHLFGNPEDDDDPVSFAQVVAESKAAVEGPLELAARLFNKMHHTTIKEMLAQAEKTWTTAPPVPTPTFADFAAAAVAPRSARAVLPGPQQARLFAESFVALHARSRQMFDKDDDVAVQFVSAVANLRALVFGIPLQSEFDIRAIAGNIIPAIATTNAMMSGTAVLEAIKILSGRVADCRMTFCHHPHPGRYWRKPCTLYPSLLLPPDPACYVCSGRTKRIQLLVDTAATTLGFLVKAALQGHLSLAEPIIDGPQGGIYDPEIHQGHPKLAKPLEAVGVTDGASLVILDTLQDFEVEATVVHVTLADPSEFQVQGEISANDTEQKKPAANAAPESDGEDDLLIYVPKNKRRAGEKRKHQQELPRQPLGADLVEQTAKRPRPSGGDAICVD